MFSKPLCKHLGMQGVNESRFAFQSHCPSLGVGGWFPREPAPPPHPLHLLSSQVAFGI